MPLEKQFEILIMRFGLPKNGDPDAAMSPDDELARVMAEIVAALGGAAAVLTLHPTAQAAEVLYADGDRLKAIASELVNAGALDWELDQPDRHDWVEGEFSPHAPHAIAIPVRRVPGHSRLVITVFFETCDAEARARAEAAYLARRPFAVGYFRLWQQDRLYRRDVEVLRAALDRVGLAVMLITRAGELASANTAASRLLAAGTGIYEQRGRLHARSRADNVALDAALDHVLEAGVPLSTLPLLLIEREGAPPLTLCIMPSPFPAIEQAEIGAMVFAVDPAMDVEDLAAPVCRAYGLTKTETALAVHLASGRTLQEATARMHLKGDTAKTYLRAIFSKMGVSRQSDLIRLILVSLMRTSDELEYELANAVHRRGRETISAL